METDNQIIESFRQLKHYVECEEFKGWDPFDGLNSRVFQALPVIRSAKWSRLVWIQLFKRNPVNLRRLLMVKKDYNPKGLGLFLHGYCNLYCLDQREEYLEKIRWLVRLIIQLVSPGYSGACWGYNFDWQARAFFQPKGTPTVVASTFIGYALFEAYEILKDNEILNVASSISGFIQMDLNKTYDDKGNFAFSYSPLDRSQVFNASLLGSRMLAKIYYYTKEQSLLDDARRSINFCVSHQQHDGSWTYSTFPFHQWIDSFHTGYNLECISEYQKYTGDKSFQEVIEQGFRYYITNFFLEDGKSKYYHNSLYPIDVHAAAQCIITLNRLGKAQDHRELAQNVLLWIIQHMQDRKGYFYFQRNKSYTSKIPYMRWAQSWMFYALSDYLREFKLETWRGGS